MDLETLAELPPWEWPQGASAMIRDRLFGDPEDAAGRLLAAELAGNLVVMDDEMARALLALLGDPGELPSLRATAAISLGPLLEEADLQDPDDPYYESYCSVEILRQVRGALAAVYRDAAAPKEVRRRALEASVRRPEPWHEGAVRAAYHDGDPTWRLTAVFCMEFVPGFRTELLETLSAAEPELVYQAVRAAGSRGVEGAWPRIRELLLAPETEKPLLLAAIEAASMVGGERDEVEEALAGLADSDDEEIAMAAVDAMVELGVWDGMGGEETFEEDW